jgi:hypothetical protein
VIGFFFSLPKSAPSEGCMAFAALTKACLAGGLVGGLAAGLVGGLSGCATQSVSSSASPSGSSSASRAELGRDTIRAVVHAHFRAVSACYEEAIDARPGAMGKVMAEWDISPDGSVGHVVFSEVDPTLEAIKPCLSKEIATWKFPPSSAADETTVKYPFFFDERIPLR